MAYSRIVLVAIVACVLVLGIHDTSGDTTGCPTFCTYEYFPICGRRADGSTREFGNKCDLRSYQCRNPGEIVSTQNGRC